MSSFTANTITRSGVNAFSDWTVGNDIVQSAVRLKSLAARAALPQVLALVGAAALLALAGRGLQCKRKPSS